MILSGVLLRLQEIAGKVEAAIDRPLGTSDTGKKYVALLLIVLAVKVEF